MSISSFCIEQHKKEQEALKKFLIYSFAGSAVLHIVLALGISWAWETRPELAEDPIEIILVEEPEVPEPEEQPLKETPKPKPKAVETPTPPQPTKTQIPEPIKPQQRAEALPQKTVKQPVPAIPATPQRAVTPPAPTSVEPPTEPTRERRTVVTPPSEPVREPSDPALSPPEPVAINNNSAPPRPENNSQPLQTDSDVEKLRERLSEPTTTESTVPPNDDASEANRTSPGAVAKNPSVPPRPRGVSGILSDASKITENIRERLGDSFSPSADSVSDSDSIANPGVPGEVATDSSAPTRPSSSSQPLSGSSSGSQPFRESLGGESSGERASSSEGDSIANPGVPGEVARNSSVPSRPAGNSESLPVSSAAGCTATRKPEFPSSLANQGIEARPVVELIVDEKGKVIESKLVEPSSYPAINQAALETVTSVSCPAQGNRRRVRMGISFAQPGTDFEREARQRAEKLERERQAQLERERQERERQGQLEQERREQERQAQLEQERQEQLEQERQEQLERERQEQERQEQLERERQEQERQEQLERERQEQERQEQLERERQERERQEQLERERQEQERQEQLEPEPLEQVEEVPPPEPTE